MATKEKVHDQGMVSRAGFIDWATMGLPDPLASSARDALWAIATTGAPKDEGEDWTLFGEVLGHSTGPPFCVSLRRVSLLMTSDAMPSGAQWEHFDLICPVEHKRVDFAPGMLIGIHTKSVNRSEPCKVVADESVPVWNISSFDRCLAWNVTHLFAGAYEGWLRSMWWAQQANLGLSFATHTSADWCPEVMKTWGYNHGRPVQQCPIPVTYNPVESINGILADISDLTLLRASANKSNLLMTLSPPCPQHRPVKATFMWDRVLQVGTIMQRPAMLDLDQVQRAEGHGCDC